MPNKENPIGSSRSTSSCSSPRKRLHRLLKNTHNRNNSCDTTQTTTVATVRLRSHTDAVLVVKHRIFLRKFKRRYRKALLRLRVGSHETSFVTLLGNELTSDGAYKSNDTITKQPNIRESDDLAPQSSPPFAVQSLLEHETTLCDSPKDRGIITDHNSTITHHRLPFGYFSSGNKLFRNKLNDQEVSEDGFLALHELVLPQCQSALMTTFDSTVCMKPSIHLANEICPDVRHVLLVGHSNYLGSPFLGLRMPSVASNSDDSNLPNPTFHQRRREWYWMACQPFGRPQHLMHAKILLFRSTQGLRVIVSGNNLTTTQWTEDRDCFWIQDIPATTTCTTANGHDAHSSYSPHHYVLLPTTGNTSDELPMVRLRQFLVDLLKSSSAFYNIDNRMDDQFLTFIHNKLWDLFGNLDESTLHSGVRFVYSFPRMRNRGGWQQLCQAIWELRQQVSQKQSSTTTTAEEIDDLWYDTDDGDGDLEGYGMQTMKNIRLYAMSGSFGDLKPDFLLQMKLAFSGCQHIAKSYQGREKDDQDIDNNKEKYTETLGKSTPWSKIFNIFCLWPSHETVLTMNPMALRARCRPMCRKHWDTIPYKARQRFFFDAIPNPPDIPALASSTESQLAAGFGRNLAPQFGGYRLKAGPRSSYHSFAHGKAIYASTMKESKLATQSTNSNSSRGDIPFTAVYVGSHNWSRAAWGLRSCQPNNVEFGVVLLTTDHHLALEWKSRLPYQLPDPTSISPRDYRPGRSRDIFERVEIETTAFEVDDDSSVETLLL